MDIFDESHWLGINVRSVACLLTQRKNWNDTRLNEYMIEYVAAPVAAMNARSSQFVITRAEAAGDVARKPSIFLFNFCELFQSPTRNYCQSLKLPIDFDT